MLSLVLFLVASVGLCNCNQRPNFVIVLTDDQDVALDGMNPMVNVQRFIGNEGVTFANSYVTSPICCPSRTSFLTGLYLHNHGAYNNSRAGGCHGENWKTHEKNTFATVLQASGYSTFYAGKYLNQYGVEASGGPEYVPSGWSEWHGLVGNSRYYNYTVSNDGVPTHSADLYLTDVIRNVSLNYIENRKESKPFLMVLAPPAPHAPFTPANRHEGLFQNITAVRHPNFNIAVDDKHWLLTMPPSPLPENMMPELDRVYRSRWETLLSVDEMVADVINSLDTRSLLDNTYFIYTSDNGYHIGQFSQVYDKRQPYEADIKVPLLIRGPGVSKNAISHEPVLNIDLAPTIIKLAGLEPPKSMDGHAIDLFGQGRVRDRNMLVEFYGEGNDQTVDGSCPWKYDVDNLSECYPQYECKCQDSRNNTYACIRHIARRVDFKYCSFDDEKKFVEMYDLAEDPYELKNKVNQVLPSIKHWYDLVLRLMMACKGVDECDKVNENLINLHNTLQL